MIEGNDSMNEQNRLIKYSILDNYGEDLTARRYIVNPAIAREEEIKKIILILLTPEKSVLLVGPAGSGKTALVEGLSYKIQRVEVPLALSGYRVIRINSTSLIGEISINGQVENKMTLLMEELKIRGRIILFIDEIHTLIGSENQGPMDFANMLKPGLDRGDIKVIGATTNMEYEEYIVTDTAFLRRFELVDVNEPTAEMTVEILDKSIPKLEIKTNVRMTLSPLIRRRVLEFIVEMTSKYKRLYALSSNYPDISLALLADCFSQAVYENSPGVTLKHVFKAIKACQSVYPDILQKEIKRFREVFSQLVPPNTFE
jgi:ATP-dependent Clp protease ATP-binding subunit ClpA